MTSTQLSGESIAVVGAGIGGLAASAQLAASGADVSVYERRDQVGGVAGRLEADGFRFDTGPSWYLMPEVFERFFGSFDTQPSDHYDLVRLDPHYRIFWDDGDRVDVTGDTEELVTLFESYERGAGDALRRYLADAEETYDLGMDRFVLPNRTRFREYLSLDVIRSGRALSLLGSMDSHVQRYFEHPKLRQIVEYSLVFIGGSPYNVPALYKLMSHVDLGLGVYYPQGGLYEVVEAIETVAIQEGVDIQTDSGVESLEPLDDGMAVDLGDDTAVHDRVVSNAPPEHVERTLLPDGTGGRDGSYWEGRTYGPSAFLLYLGVEGDVDPLEHHTLVLPTDWKPHFDAIFDSPGWPENPAYYVNVPSKTDPSVAPDGCETVVVLVPLAPGLDDSSERRSAFREQLFDDLKRTTGVELRDRIIFEETACISEFEQGFNRPRGTALGLAHTRTQTGPFRPGHRAPGLDRLYYVGSDTNPGIGVPMCLLSGEHVADTVESDGTDRSFF